MGLGVQRHVPRRFTPEKETRYPLYRRLGGPQGRCGQVRKISPPPGFDSRTVQPVASRYTDYATQPTILYYIRCKNLLTVDLVNGLEIIWKIGPQQMQYNVLTLGVRQ